MPEKTVKIFVIPSSKVEGIEEGDGLLIVRVRARSEKGKANKRVAKLLAKYYGVPTSSIEIVRGLTARNKTVKITI